MIKQFFSLVAGITATLLSGALAADNFDIRPDRDRIGRIYNYVRSNTDSSNRESIAVFRRDRENIEVYKSRDKCLNAALVTAEMDFEMRSAARITGGRLLPGAQHQEFAFLTYDKASSKVLIEVRLPDQELVHELDIGDGPWQLFDFDFASLTVMTPHLRDVEQGFSFELPLLWADANDNPIRYLGHLSASYAGTAAVGHMPVNRYLVSGGSAGEIWLDITDGHIVLAELDKPNHPGYKDFRLELVSVNDGGLEAWTAMLEAHYEGCE
jgi:hypothetical protein